VTTLIVISPPFRPVNGGLGVPAAWASTHEPEGYALTIAINLSTTLRSAHVRAKP
jgi:hypothetical protein